MKIDDLRHAYQARPFRPFSIRVADGREYQVDHPEFLSFSTTGRTIVVSTPKDLHGIIGTAMITSIHLGNGKPRRGRGKKP